MKVTLRILLFFIAILILSCTNKISKNKDTLKTRLPDSVNTETNVITKKDNQIKRDTYFKATGNEPFWSLEMSDSLVKLTTIEDSIITPHTAPIRAMDANIKLYKIQTETCEMTIKITQSECTNSMSGEVSLYSVAVNYKKNSDKKSIQLQGCGFYITDYRLHDIWVLEKMNGSKITKIDFSNGFPTMEINSTTHKFLGFAGCNRMNGSLFFEKGLLRFTKIVTTEMMCEPSNKEPDFLNTLQNSTSFKIENNRLILSNPDGELLTFKKID
ncbi:META domain-containing protein [Flavobacterium jejuense]|uniref:META domain-containing protein n=1 Tax=Flavobacterium jejuense TaxID=1544455 RepID=A0ABX0IV77_9FLAO|nr:META domain-containing protein [Flavobacterium jejuense]NHN27722.1 META domain-containing protein [Flavobacterium jejuense]